MTWTCTSLRSMAPKAIPSSIPAYLFAKKVASSILMEILGFEPSPSTCNVDILPTKSYPLSSYISAARISKIQNILVQIYCKYLSFMITTLYRSAMLAKLGLAGIEPTFQGLKILCIHRYTKVPYIARSKTRTYNQNSFKVLLYQLSFTGFKN